MKKTILTIAIILGLATAGLADPNGGGVFGRGESSNQQGSRTEGLRPRLPQHGESTNQAAPVGSGAVILTALGAAYLVGKRRREE